MNLETALDIIVVKFKGRKIEPELLNEITKEIENLLGSLDTPQYKVHNAAMTESGNLMIVLRDGKSGYRKLKPPSTEE
jgi:hypothetical protein